jgi:predicted HAD superfamily Cof-like phosphohydrolase
MPTEKQETELLIKLEQFFINSNITNVSIPDIEKLRDLIIEEQKINSYNGKVDEFMFLFKQTINNEPTFPEREIIELRLSLILEELTELAEACGSETLSKFGTSLFKKSEVIRNDVEQQREKLKPKMVEVLDAFADLQYVLSGAIITFGLQNKIDEAFEEVHESNLSKLCINAQEAEETQVQYQKKGVEVDIEATKGYFIIKRKEDNKVLKSINYKPANLLPILTKE